MQKLFAELIASAEEKDQEAISELYNRTYPGVYKTAKAIIQDEDAVLDIVQDTYIKAFQNLHQLDDPDKFPAWVKRIAVNQAKDYLKKKKPILFTEMENEDGDTPEFRDDNMDVQPEAVIDRQDTTELISRILSTLGDEQRITIVMFYYQELSVEEIAKAQGCSVNTVKSRLNYGRKKVEKAVLKLEKQGVKLYSMAPFAFFLWLLGLAEDESVPISVLLQMPATGAAVTGVGAVSTVVGESAAGNAAAGIAAKAASGVFTKAAAVKLAAGALAVSIVGGGTVAAVNYIDRSKTDETELTSYTEVLEQAVNETVLLDATSESTEAVTQKHTHNWTEEVIAPSCTQGGYTLCTCSCGESRRESLTQPVGHIWSAWETAIQANSVYEGKEERQCTICGETESKAIAKLPSESPAHYYVGTVIKEATCTDTGIKVFVCDDCGDSYTEEIAATGHAYTDTVIAPTCTTGGYTQHICSNCGNTYQDNEVESIGHDYDGEVLKSPTCTEEGLSGLTCVRCGDYYTQVSPIFHDYRISTYAPTCAADGFVTGICSICGSSYSNSIPALGHSWSDWEPIPENSPETPGSNGSPGSSPAAPGSNYVKRTCSTCGTVEWTPADSVSTP